MSPKDPLALHRVDETGTRQTIALARLDWAAGPCEIIDVRTDAERRRLEHCAARFLGGHPVPLRRPPGAVLLPQGVWDTEELPECPRYEPLAHRERLLTAILRADSELRKQPSSETAIVDFARTWGLLGVGLHGHPGFPFDAVDLVERALRGLAGPGLRALAAIRAKDWRQADVYYPLPKPFEGRRSSYYWQAWRLWLNGRLRGDAPESGGGVYLSLELDPEREDGRPAWTFRPSSLAAACYGALVFSLTRAEPLVECRECRNPFEPTRAEQEFCPPPSWEDGARSLCLNRFSVRRWRREHPRRAPAGRSRASGQLRRRQSE